MQTVKHDTFPQQHQNTQPGKESDMHPEPVYENDEYKSSGKLTGKVALISGGDSGIGRAISIAFAKEGADIAFIYLNETKDATLTTKRIQSLGRRCVQISADLKESKSSDSAVMQTIENLGKIDILINNAGVQYPQNSILDITDDQLHHTFESNIFSSFYLTRSVLPYLQRGSSIINTASITAFKGHEELIDYSATKGAIVSFTRSMALSLIKQGIRVNAVAPGPVWTPLIVSSFSEEEVKTFGSTSPMERSAQPYELAPMYVFLASEDSSNISGQIFHVNGGTIIN